MNTAENYVPLRNTVEKYAHCTVEECSKSENEVLNQTRLQLEWENWIRPLSKTRIYCYSCTLSIASKVIESY